MRRGTSPLIAETLMIAIVFSTAVVIGTWLEPLAREHTDQVEQRADTVHECTRTRLDIVATAHTDTEVNVTVTNTGVMPLHYVRAYVTADGRVLDSAQLGSLTAAETVSATIPVEQPPERVTVATRTCPKLPATQQLE